MDLGAIGAAIPSAPLDQANHTAAVDHMTGGDPGIVSYFKGSADAILHAAFDLNRDRWIANARWWEGRAGGNGIVWGWARRRDDGSGSARRRRFIKRLQQQRHENRQNGAQQAQTGSAQELCRLP